MIFTEFFVKQIGVVGVDNAGYFIELEPEYRPALEGLQGFDHLNVLWWFSGSDSEAARARLTEEKPYTTGPDMLGTFATRSPERPNPIALSCAGVTYLKEGRIGLDYLDAEAGSPVLDLKPYIPSLDRVEAPGVPDWCSHWPSSVETSGDFDWGAEFRF